MCIGWHISKGSVVFMYVSVMDCIYVWGVMMWDAGVNIGLHIRPGGYLIV